MADFPQEEAGWLPGASQFGELKSQWDSFLEQPGARTALLQFGINMMQPPSFGDTPVSQFGRALGSAGEATTRQQEIERRERESEDKSEIGFMRADAAQQRAAMREQGADYKGRELDLKERTFEERKERSRLQTQLDSLRRYQDYVKQVKLNDAKQKKIWADSIGGMTGKTSPPPETPILGPEEWAAQMGMPAPAVRTRPGDTPAVPSTAPGPASSAVPPAPNNPKDRKVGQRYMTPRGPMTWFEDGWE